MENEEIERIIQERARLSYTERAVKEGEITNLNKKVDTNFATLYKLDFVVKSGDKEYTIKCLYKKFKSFVDFLVEMQTLAIFSHPTIEKMLAWSANDSDHSYGIVVKEEISNINKYISKKKSSSEPLNIYIPLFAYGVISGLRCMHSKNCIHRDIKPDNLLVSQMKLKEDIFYVPIICDFNVSKHGDGTTLAGTNNFIAPEIQNNKPYTYKCDVYSFGKTFKDIMKDCGDKDSPLFDELEQLFDICANYKPEDRPETLSIMTRLKNIVFNNTEEGDEDRRRFIEYCQYIDEFEKSENRINPFDPNPIQVDKDNYEELLCAGLRYEFGIGTSVDLHQAMFCYSAAQIMNEDEESMHTQRVLKKLNIDVPSEDMKLVLQSLRSHAMSHDAVAAGRYGIYLASRYFINNDDDLKTQAKYFLKIGKATKSQDVYACIAKIAIREQEWDKALRALGHVKSSEFDEMKEYVKVQKELSSLIE